MLSGRNWIGVSAPSKPTAGRGGRLGVPGPKFGSASSRGEAGSLHGEAADVEEAFEVADLQPQVQPQAAKGPDWG